MGESNGKKYLNGTSEKILRWEHYDKICLIPKMPAIIRVDGRSFKSYTRHLNKPFDDEIISAFIRTSRKSFSEIENCRLSYTQSDEISFLMTDYENENTCPWFGGNIQKIVSNVASIVSVIFGQEIPGEYGIPYFDARVFNLPRDLVNDYFMERQKNWQTNSVNMVARTFYSHKQLMNKSTREVKEMLKEEKDYVWNDLPITNKLGCTHIRDRSCCNNLRMLEGNEEGFYKDSNIVNQFVYPNEGEVECQNGKS